MAYQCRSLQSLELAQLQAESQAVVLNCSRRLWRRCLSVGGRVLASVGAF